MDRRDAVEKALERFRPVLVTLAEAMISPAYRGNIEASDLVQQTLMEAHTHARILGAFDEGPFFAWLRKALQNNLLDAVKHLTPRRKMLVEEYASRKLKSHLPGWSKCWSGMRLLPANWFSETNRSPSCCQSSSTARQPANGSHHEAPSRSLTKGSCGIAGALGVRHGRSAPQRKAAIASLHGYASR